MLEIFMERRLAADDQHFLYSFDNFVSVCFKLVYNTRTLRTFNLSFDIKLQASESQTYKIY